jgi:hypothetical protein
MTFLFYLSLSYKKNKKVVTKKPHFFILSNNVVTDSNCIVLLEKLQL